MQKQENSLFCIYHFAFAVLHFFAALCALASSEFNKRLLAHISG
jgi:hypothetical protein